MEYPIFAVKETKLGYIAIIIGVILFFAGMIAVGMLMINVSRIDSSITERQGLFFSIAGIIYIIIFAIICLGIICYCLVALSKKKIAFFEDRVAIMFGDKQIYKFYYADIINYHIFKGLSNINISVSKLYHYKHGEMNGRMFDLSFTSSDLQRVKDILNEKLK